MITGDSHIHIALDGVDYRHAEARHRSGETQRHVLDILKEYGENGISFLRDGGDKWGASEFASRAAADFGIDYRTPVFPIYKKGNYGAFLGRGYETEKDALALIKEAESRGCDFIKLMASGIMDFARRGELTGFGLPEGDLRTIISAAHGMGLSVMVHVNGADNIKRALDAGADSIEHGFFADGAAVAMMRDVHAVWVPTIAPVADLIGTGQFDDAALEYIAASQKAAVRQAAEAGCLIAAGSDGGCGGVAHVKGLSDEISLLKDALGAGAEEVLAAGESEIKRRFARGGVC